jgi:hypothetical protein
MDRTAHASGGLTVACRAGGRLKEIKKLLLALSPTGSAAYGKLARRTFAVTGARPMISDMETGRETGVQCRPRVELSCHGRCIRAYFLLNAAAQILAYKAAKKTNLNTNQRLLGRAKASA